MKVAFKNCAPFTKCLTHINYEHVDDTEYHDIVMPMYNLIEYSNNYSDNSKKFIAVYKRLTKYDQWRPCWCYNKWFTII